MSVNLPLKEKTVSKDGDVINGNLQVKGSLTNKNGFIYRPITMATYYRETANPPTTLTTMYTYTVPCDAYVICTPRIYYSNYPGKEVAVAVNGTNHYGVYGYDDTDSGVMCTFMRQCKAGDKLNVMASWRRSGSASTAWYIDIMVIPL